MFRSLWLRFLILLVAVSAVALSAALFLRELMVKDFREYLEGEREDRVYWVTASLESSYEKNAGWNEERVREDMLWAYMLGFEVILRRADGAVIMDSERAISSLSPLFRKRILAISERRSADKGDVYFPYALFLGGQEIGQLDVKFLSFQKEAIFIRRSDRLLLLSLVLLGSLAITLSIIFSKRLTDPIKKLTMAVAAIGDGDLGHRVRAQGGDEIGRLSDAFNKMAENLEVQESLRKRLTSNVAHELRTPISAIRGELEGMMDGFIPADREHLQSLYEEIGRLRRMLDGVEELSRAEASRLNLQKQTIDLKQFLRNILDRFGKSMSDKGVHPVLSCGDGLRLIADPDRLSQVMINLLSNALRSTEGGGSVELKAYRNGSEIVIEVIDSGKGIKAEDLPFIFERFYKTSEGGLGLGLAIVRELVDAHGGRISVQSEYGKGAAFILSFPYSS